MGTIISKIKSNEYTRVILNDFKIPISIHNIITRPPRKRPRRVGIDQNWINDLYYVKYDFQPDGHRIFCSVRSQNEKTQNFRMTFKQGISDWDDTHVVENLKSRQARKEFFSNFREKLPAWLFWISNFPPHQCHSSLNCPIKRPT